LTANFKKKDTQQHSMCNFLPDAHDGLRSLLGEITSRPRFVHDHLPSSEVKVCDFRLPKFKLEFKSNVTQILKRSGLVLPFGMGANLSDMVEADGGGMPLVVLDVDLPQGCHRGQRGRHRCCSVHRHAGGSWMCAHDDGGAAG
jgi:hypothetical protein